MKRFANNYAGGSSEKRAKLINEDPWGDSDPDIEHFLLQASQIVDEIVSFPSFKHNFEVILPLQV